MTKKKKTAKKIKKSLRKREKHSVQKMRSTILKAGGNITAIATQLKMSRQGVYDFIDRHTTLKDILEEARETELDYVQSRNMINIKAGKERSIINYLSTRGRKRGWGKHLELDHNPEGKTIKISFKKKDK